MNWKDYYNFFTGLIVSVGGPTVIILAVSKWFGENVSKTWFAKQQSKYDKELETFKAEIDREKSRFNRYSEQQFSLYNDLWKILMRTKVQADDLWSNPSPERLPGFAEQVRLTRRAVMDNMLLIEQKHYDQLDILMGSFEGLLFGKTKLIEIIQGVDDRGFGVDVSQTEVDRVINKNRKLKGEYSSLIMKIGKSLRDQIRG